MPPAHVNGSTHCNVITESRNDWISVYSVLFFFFGGYGKYIYQGYSESGYGAFQE